jgi:hypothetical protein
MQRLRRGTLTTITGMFAVAAAVALVGVAPAQATSIPPSGWYMLVNDYYDGGSGDDGGHLWCLSTNAQTPSGLAGTHYVYLAVCNPATPAQWWYNDNGDVNVDDPKLLRNYEDFDGALWELSANATAAYTAKHNTTTATHQWNVWENEATVNTYEFSNAGLSPNPPRRGIELSASSSGAPFDGTKNVYPAAASDAPAHKWRYYQPAGRPTNCECGVTS